jgi:hypothetical protein
LPIVSSGYNGTLAGNATFVPSGGIAGGAVSLSASGGGYVDMGVVLNNLYGTSYTICAWVNTDASTGYPGDETNQTVVASHRSSIVAG